MCIGFCNRFTLDGRRIHKDTCDIMPVCLGSFLFIMPDSLHDLYTAKPSYSQNTIPKTIRTVLFTKVLGKITYFEESQQIYSILIHQVI